MINRLKEYNPQNILQKYIDSFWVFRNNTGVEINFPVVPDGCSDIIYYLKNSTKLTDLEGPLINGVMESAELVPIPDKMELFGMRFKPGVLWYMLKTDMKELKGKMCSLFEINKELPKILQIDKNAGDEGIVSGISNKLEELLLNIFPDDNFLETVNKLCNNPEITITELAKTGASVSFYMEVENLDAFYREIKGKVEVVKELSTTWYGMKEFYIYDNNGYVLGFAEQKV